MWKNENIGCGVLNMWIVIIAVAILVTILYPALERIGIVDHKHSVVPQKANQRAK